jgi:hypothetical protein
MLRKDRSFTVITLRCLALGMGLNATIFAVVDRLVARRERGVPSVVTSISGIDERKFLGACPRLEENVKQRCPFLALFWRQPSATPSKCPAQGECAVTA